MQNLRAAALFLLAAAAAAATAMVIGDGDSSTEFTGSTESEVETAPASSSSPPPPSPSTADLLKGLNWNCDIVTPISNLSLESIMGRWYLLEVISPSGGRRQDACAGVDFWRWDDEENSLMPGVPAPAGTPEQHLVMRGFNRHGSGQTSSYRIDTADVIDGSGNAIWDQDVAMGATVAVVDFSQDERFLTVTTCSRAVSYEWTCVMGREPNVTVLPREDIHTRLRAAGVGNTENGLLQDNTDCTYR